MNKIKLLFILLFISFSIQLAQDLVTDRPDQTESSSTVNKNSLQIESGFVLSNIGTKLNTEKQIVFPTTLFRFGLTNGIEIRLLNQFESIENEFKLNNKKVSGFSDFEIGAKVQILRNENINTEIAFISHLVLPTGTNSFSINEVGVINKLALSHSISKNIGIGYNLGYDYLGYGSGILTYSFVTGFSVTEKLELYLETYGEYDDFKDYLSNFDSGFTYLVKNNLKVDFSFGTGMNHEMNYLSAGFSWNISD